MQKAKRSLRPEDRTRIRQNKKNLEKRVQKVIDVLIDPSREIDLKFLSKWENAIVDQIAVEDTIPLLTQMLNIASGYKQLMLLGEWKESDRLDLATFAGWVDTELKRIRMLGKKGMDPETQLEIT